MKSDITTEQLGRVASIVIGAIRGVSLPPQADEALRQELSIASPSRHQEIRSGVCQGLKMLFRDPGFWSPAIQTKVSAALSANGLPDIKNVSASIGIKTA
jgi:hypothetical protein